MAAAVLVAVTDHRRQRGGLAGTGSPDEQHQAALGQRQLLEDFRQLEFVDGRDIGLDPAQHHAHQVALVEGADTETTDTTGADGEVALMVLGKVAALCFVHHTQHGLAGLLRRHGVLGHRHDLAIDLHRRRDASGDEQVGAAFFHHQAQQFFEFHLRFRSSTTRTGFGRPRQGLSDCWRVPQSLALRPTAGRSTLLVRDFPDSWPSRARCRG